MRSYNKSELERVLFGAFIDIKVPELANLSLRQNLRHYFCLFGAGVDHHEAIECMNRKVTSDFFAVAMLPIGESSIHPVQVVIQKGNLKSVTGDEIDRGCARLSKLDIVKALPEPRDAIYAIVEDEH